MCVSFFLSCDEFDIGYVQHQSLRALALRGEESAQPERAAEGPAGEQPGLRLEGHRAELRAHLALRARLVLLRLVRDLEVDRGEPAGRVAQRAELKQPAAQL
jgi:hypothetical protein